MVKELSKEQEQQIDCHHVLAYPWDFKTAMSNDQETIYYVEAVASCRKCGLAFSLTSMQPRRKLNL